MSLKKLKKTAVEFDEIPVWLLKEKAHIVTFALSHIYSLSLKLGPFPTSLKTAKINSLPKVSKPKLLSDFRPVAVTPVIARHFERIVYTKFLNSKFLHCLYKVSGRDAISLDSETGDPLQTPFSREWIVSSISVLKVSIVYEYFP